MWEYEEETVGKDDILARCNARGAQGWRLVASFGVALASLVSVHDRSARPGAVLLFEREKVAPAEGKEG